MWNIEKLGYEKEFIYYFPSHPEAVDDYCAYLAGLYELARVNDEYEVKRSVYFYLENHEVVLKWLLHNTPDEFTSSVKSKEEFLHSEPETPMPENLIGDVCSVFSKAFKISVVMRDLEAVIIMAETLEWFEKIVFFLASGVTFDDDEVGDDIRRQLAEKDRILTSKIIREG
jgi:hypothetical protein